MLWSFDAVNKHVHSDEKCKEEQAKQQYNVHLFSAHVMW
jgi:hypothetical protein